MVSYADGWLYCGKGSHWIRLEDTKLDVGNRLMCQKHGRPVRLKVMKSRRHTNEKRKRLGGN